MECGAIYIVTRDARYLDLLASSVKRLKHVMPDLPITVFSDLPAEGPFTLIRVPSSGSDGFFDKARLMAESAYDRTVFLDTDIFVVEPFWELFDMLDRFDCALTHEEYVSTDWSHHYNRPDIPASFPEFNTGLIAYRRSPTNAELFKEWNDLYRCFLAEHPSKAINDQPFFRAAAYLSEARIATLPREYNCKFRGNGYLNGSVKLLHGHVKFEMGHEYMERVAGLFNRSLRPRVYVGRTLYEQHITGRLWGLRKPRKVGSFPEPISLWKLRASQAKEIVARLIRIPHTDVINYSRVSSSSRANHNV